MEVYLPLLQFMILGITVIEFIPLMWLFPRQKVEFCVYNAVLVKFILLKYFFKSHTGLCGQNSRKAVWLQTQYC